MSVAASLFGSPAVLTRVTLSVSFVPSRNALISVHHRKAVWCLATLGLTPRKVLSSIFFLRNIILLIYSHFSVALPPSPSILLYFCWLTEQLNVLASGGSNWTRKQKVWVAQSHPGHPTRTCNNCWPALFNWGGSCLFPFPHPHYKSNIYKIASYLSCCNLILTICYYSKRASCVWKVLMRVNQLTWMDWMGHGVCSTHLLLMSSFFSSPLPGFPSFRFYSLAKCRLTPFFPLSFLPAKTSWFFTWWLLWY